MDKKYYLLLKQHNKTGLKYLCFHYGTFKSCFSYKGSGFYWLNHLKKHGKSISTIILKESEDKSDISEAGIKYSILWNVVNSKEFANLIIENAESDSSKLHTPEARERRRLSLLNRISKNGLTEPEKEAKIRAINAMHSPENRKKAFASIRKRFESGNLTDKQRTRGVDRKRRIKEIGYTKKEIQAHKDITKRQLGLTMKERLNNPNWSNPNKGKTAYEIYGDDYVNFKKGKKLKDIIGSDYVDPRGKPVKIVVNDSEVKLFESENDFLRKCRLSSKIMPKFKSTGVYVIKRQKNSTHEFSSGDILKYYSITIDEYKSFFSN